MTLDLQTELEVKKSLPFFAGAEDEEEDSDKELDDEDLLDDEDEVDDLEDEEE